MTMRAVSVVLFGFLIQPTSAWADSVYSLNLSQTHLALDPGSAADIDLYVRETGGTTLHDAGILWAGWSLTSDTNFDLLASRLFDLNPAFSLASAESDLLTKTLRVQEYPTAGVFMGNHVDNNPLNPVEIFLGTLHLALPGNAVPVPTHFVFAGFRALGNTPSFLLGDQGGTGFDPQPVTLSINDASVPAPLPAVLWAGLALIGLAGTSRSRQRTRRLS